MNLKTLRKKIRKLETRLQEGPAKLARWKSKLAKMEKAKAQKAKTETAALVAQRETTPKSTHGENKPSAKSPAKAADARGNSPAAKVKRKLNLSPERRAQLSAAMKARWVAKRAGAGTGPQNGSSKQAAPAS
jgi:hypothetical protein